MAGLRDEIGPDVAATFDELQSSTGPVVRALLRRLSGETGETVTEWPCRVFREPRRGFVARSGGTLASEPNARSYTIEGLPVGVEPRTGDTLVVEDQGGATDFAFLWNARTVPLAQEFHITLPDEESAGMGLLHTVLVR
jgi:hypothetical protein